MSLGVSHEMMFNVHRIDLIMEKINSTSSMCICIFDSKWVKKKPYEVVGNGDGTARKKTVINQGLRTKYALSFIKSKNREIEHIQREKKKKSESNQM